MPSSTVLREKFQRYALSINDLISLLIIGWVLPQQLRWEGLPRGFLLLAVLAIVLAPHGDEATTGMRWWLLNLSRRIGISIVTIGVMYFWAPTTAYIATTFGAWCALALLWFPPALRAKWAERNWYRERWQSPVDATLLPISEGVMLAMSLTLTRRFWPELCPSDQTMIVVWAVWIFFAALAQKFFRLHVITSVSFRCGVFVLVFAAWIFFRDLPFQRGHGAICLVNALALITPYWAGQRFGAQARDLRTEIFRNASIMGATFLLFQPIAFPALHGAGDALWYATMLADVMEQVGAGYFPIFGGQTVYQFNGSVFPYRVAPGFLYLGAGFDLLTFRSLGSVAVQNFFLTVWGLLSALVCYVCLANLAPRNRWVACAGAFLFIACPGVMGLVYNTDLYMSWTTVPFLLLAFTASFRLFNEIRLRTMSLLAASLGLLWWGHTPIALWATGLVGGIQLVNIIQQRELFKTRWPILLMGAIIFTLVAMFPIGIALWYMPEAGTSASGFTQASATTIVHFLREVFPDVLLPLKSFGRALSSFQLGYSLWVIFGLSLYIAFQQKIKVSRLVLGAALVPAILLIPWPTIDIALWGLIPGFVRNTTGNWVMNRLYLVLSATIVVGAATVLRSRTTNLPNSPRESLTMFMILACGWSALEGSKFGQLSSIARRSLDSGRTALLSENVSVTRFAYFIFPQSPAYYSHGVVDPELEHRFFSDDGQLLWSNTSAILQAVQNQDPRVKAVSLGTFAPLTEHRDVWRLSQPIRLQSDRRYILHFDFAGTAAVSGVLQVIGKSLFREYELPISGGAKSFGSAPNAQNTLPIWTSENDGDEVEVSFRPRPDCDMNVIDDISVRIIEYTPHLLPARVLSWAPYRVQITSQVDGWLETPRSYQRYWKSDEGRSVIKKSPEGLVMLKHSGSGSIKELHYAVPLGYMLLFWASILCAFAVFCVQFKRPSMSEISASPAS